MSGRFAPAAVVRLWLWFRRKAAPTRSKSYRSTLSSISPAHAVGGVITPGEQIMLVAPETDALTVVIKICTCHCGPWKYRSDYTVSAKSLLLGPSNELVE
jgi:hypothetical protein